MDCGSCFSQLADIPSRLQYRTSARKRSRVVYLGNESRASLIVSTAYMRQSLARSAGHRLGYYIKESTFPSIIELYRTLQIFQRIQLQHASQIQSISLRRHRGLRLTRNRAIAQIFRSNFISNFSSFLCLRNSVATAVSIRNPVLFQFCFVSVSQTL